MGYGAALAVSVSITAAIFKTPLWMNRRWESCRCLTDVGVFQELKSVGLDLSHDAADLPVNRPKNRYTNILPCESLTAKHHG